MAANLGITGIVVSNHRGMIAGRWTHRDCLVNIVVAVGDEIDILFDSGIRYGSDIAKAMAIGAKMVLIGRRIFMAWCSVKKSVWAMFYATFWEI